MHFHLFLVQLFLSMFCYNNTLNRLVHLTTILHWLTRLKDGTSGHHCSTSHFILCLCHATQAGRGIVFSTSPFVHLLPNFWTRYFKNYKPILIAQVVSGQGHEMITFGDQKADISLDFLASNSFSSFACGVLRSFTPSAQKVTDWRDHLHSS